MSEFSINNGNFLWMTRGKEWGFRFLSKCSYLPSAAVYDIYNKVFKDESQFGYWKGCIFVDGVRKQYVACRCYDSTIQRDQAGRHIPHEFLLLCTDEEYTLISGLAWGSLIIEQIRELYSGRYSCCAEDVTDCLINFSILLDKGVALEDSCVSLDVSVSQTTTGREVNTPLQDRKRLLLFPSLLICIVLTCLGVKYIPMGLEIRDTSTQKKTVARFCDNGEDYLPVRGVNGAHVSIGRTPVTEAEWAKFTGQTIPSDRLRHPVTNVSVKDAERYCVWLMQNDAIHTYRLPTETEWENAAGTMPKDAKFNCRVGGGIEPVDEYAMTKGACGGIDFWGNCWELTSTKRGEGSVAVKGGAFDSKRAECRTEVRTESRKSAERYPNVTFRVVRQDK